MGDLLGGLNDLAVDLAGSPWAFVVVFANSAIDGFFPPIPAESVIVALAAIGAAEGEPSLVLLGIVAGLGALLGDNVAYWLGVKVGVERFHAERHPRTARAIAWSRRELDRRGAALILAARYIPVGRTAVNMTAGATGFAWRRFFALSVLAAVSWAAYAVLIGVIAGGWVEDHPLLGAVLAVVVAAAIGAVVDRAIRLRRRRTAETV